MLQAYMTSFTYERRIKAQSSRKRALYWQQKSVPISEARMFFSLADMRQHRPHQHWRRRRRRRRQQICSIKRHGYSAAEILRKNTHLLQGLLFEHHFGTLTLIALTVQKFRFIEFLQIIFPGSSEIGRWILKQEEIFRSLFLQNAQKINPETLLTLGAWPWKVNVAHINKLACENPSLFAGAHFCFCLLD